MLYESFLTAFNVTTTLLYNWYFKCHNCSAIFINYTFPVIRREKCPTRAGEMSVYHIVNHFVLGPLGDSMVSVEWFFLVWLDRMQSRFYCDSCGWFIKKKSEFIGYNRAHYYTQFRDLVKTLFFSFWRRVRHASIYTAPIIIISLNTKPHLQTRTLISL